MRLIYGPPNIFEIFEGGGTLFGKTIKHKMNDLISNKNRASRQFLNCFIFKS